jgi:hypothetical protein
VKNKKEIWLVIAIIIIYVVLGFFRDAVFMNINSQLYKLYFKNYEYTFPNWLSFLSDWPYMRLYYFKYVLTAIFIAVYFAMCYVSILFFTYKKSNIKWVLIAYGGILIISALFYVGGLFVGNFEKGYSFARTLAGLLQSPFITMVLIPALKLDSHKSDI